MDLWDSHCHIDDRAFDPDRDAAMARAAAAGVRGQVVPAVSAELWPTLRAVCSAYAGLYPAYGLHPMYLAEHRPEHIAALGDWLERERPVAVGECGLDYYVEGLARDAQRDIFLAQLGLARDFGLPVIVHARRAVEDVLQAVRWFPGITGVLHSYAGSEHQARMLLDLGFKLGFGGPVTYPGAKRLRRLVQVLPLEGLLLETDSPDQPLASHRGARNEPAYLPEVLSVIAELRDEDPKEVAAVTARATRELFGIDDGA